jgi:hypothetical protein
MDAEEDIGPRRAEVTGCCRKMQIGSFMICAAHQTFFRRPITEKELGWACGTHDKGKAYKVWFGNLKKQGGRVWKGQTWIWIGTSKRLLHNC